MCWSCDNPGGDYLFEVVIPIIRRTGWMIQGVEGQPYLAYTVGLTERGLAELVVTGLTLDRAAVLLNRLAAGPSGELGAGDQLTVEGRLLEVVELPHPEAHLFTAAALYGPDLRGVQLVWADERGVWPWSRGHRGGRGGQPVLGPRAEQRAAG